MRRFVWGAAALSVGLLAVGGLATGLTGVTGRAGSFARVPARLIRERASEPTGRGCTGQARPLMVVVGASIAAGAGVTDRSQDWAYQLASLMGWRVVVQAAPGVGFVNPGAHHSGPILRELSEVDLSRLHPQVVVVQAGHDDAAYPPGAVGAGVALALRAIEDQAPTARVVLISAFVRGVTPSASLISTDRAIDVTAQADDPDALVISPLAQHWRFPTVADRLHPSPAGHRWIAERVAAVLERDGLVADRPVCPAA